MVAAVSVGCWAGGTPTGPAFTYQGLLKEGGAPASGTYHLRFQLWDALAGGAQVGTDLDLPTVAIDNGLFRVDLDFGVLAFNGEARWLEVQVITNGGSTVTPLLPRQQVAAAPYAVYALKSGGIDAANLPNGGAWILSSSLNLGSGTLHVDPTTNRVGIGTATPVATLDVAGTARVTGFQMPTGAATGKVLRSDSAGQASWQNDGVTLPFGGTGSGSNAMCDVTNSGTGAAIKARGIQGYGIEATTDSGPAAIRGSVSAGAGVMGRADALNPASDPIGVRGFANDQTVGGTLYAYGGYFTASSFVYRSRGVYGQGNVGGYFWGPDSTSIGVQGYVQSSTGSTIGVLGESRSTSGSGVFAHNSATSGFTTGLWGEVDSATGIGVYGLCDPSTGTGKGVYGECASASGHGVYSLGRFAASGTKAFRIDHPDDPTGKYLMHYCAESPDVINFYSGKVKLDGVGEAVVELPAYFAKINKDPRYTLTAIGAAMPNLHIAQEIDEAALELGARAEPSETAPVCWFRIAGGAPNAKVSWRVEAVRNDRYMQQYGAPVEQAKVEHERGRYQQPELYGQPREMSETYRPDSSVASQSPPIAQSEGVDP